MSDRDAARAAKSHVQDLIGTDPRVNGVGLTHVGADWAVKVNVLDDRDHPDLPERVQGVRVVVRGVGGISAHAS
ncbi:hypothetical protein AB2L27_01485 [Kineococcus sp. LSe6-4]|uniref:BON domain-containing protein n=1 Tax=Kineococcus halophytocola TaxID=3234027 RepID=A0ABV4GXW4_9ACTN